MKYTLKIVSAALAALIAATSMVPMTATAATTAAPAVKAAPIYVPNIAARRTLYTLETTFKTTYAKNLKKSPKLAATFARLSLTRATNMARTSRIQRQRWIYSELALRIKAVTASPTAPVTPTVPVVTVPPVVTPPKPVTPPATVVTPPSTTKDLTPAEQQSFQAMIGSDAWWNLSQEEKIKRLTALGFSERDRGIFYSKETMRKAAITQDIYPAFANNKKCEDKTTCDLAREWSRLEGRLVYKDTPFYNEKNPTYFAAADKVFTRMSSVNIQTQAEMKALFDKVGLTYTIQTKPFYENGWDFTELDKYLDSLGNGKPKQ